jgi:hypothetical protein
MGALRSPVSVLEYVRDVLIALELQSKHLVAPFGLLPKYLDEPVGQAFPFVGLAIAIVATVCAVFVLTRSSRDVLRVAVVWVVAAYLPVSGLAALARKVSDSYAYLPMIGLAWVLGDALDTIERPPLRRLVKVLLAGACLVFVPVRFATDVTWRNGVALWSTVYEAYPRSPQVCRNLGNAFLFTPTDDPRDLHPLEAIMVYERCIATLGDRDFYLKNLAIAHRSAGHFDEARRLFLDYAEQHPGDATVARHLRELDAARAP